MCSQADDPSEHDAPRHIAPRVYELSGSYPPSTDIAALIEGAPLPPGYALDVRPQRKHLLRSLWAIRVMHDGKRVWGRAYYSPAHGIVAAQRWAWEDAGVPA